MDLATQLVELKNKCKQDYVYKVVAIKQILFDLFLVSMKNV